MALVKCRECSNPFSDQAKACPACGAPVPRFPFVSLGCIFIFLFVGFYGWTCADNWSKGYIVQRGILPSPTPNPGVERELNDVAMRGKVRVGMTKKQATIGWGKPKDINRTIHSYGVHEQWVYDGGYLYFEDDKLTTIQN